MRKRDFFRFGDLFEEEYNMYSLLYKGGISHASYNL